MKETSPFVHFSVFTHPYGHVTWGVLFCSLYNMRTNPLFNSKKSTYISVSIYIYICYINHAYQKIKTNYVNYTIVIFFLCINCLLIIDIIIII